MKILTIANSKGGVGKSTLALNLYHHIKAEGAACAIIEADNQGSLSQLSSRLELGLPVVPRSSFQEWEEILGRDERFLLIDTPPYLASDLAQIFAISDFVLIPVKASPMDAIAAADTVELLEDAKEDNPALQGGIILTMTINRTSFTEEIREILEGYELPILGEIANRVSYSRSLLSGKGAASEDAKAKGEMAALASSILIKMA